MLSCAGIKHAHCFYVANKIHYETAKEALAVTAYLYLRDYSQKSGAFKMKTHAASAEVKPEAKRVE